MTEVLLAISVAVIGYACWQLRESSKIFSASSDDWFLHIQSDADAKKVLITFYPIVGFRISGGFCEPITTRPAVTGAYWKASHAANADSITSSSEEYGRWFRHGFRYDNFGSLCWSGLDLQALIKIYRNADFRISALNVPPDYESYFDHGTGAQPKP